MKYIKYGNRTAGNDGDDNVFWVTMSDLLLGLAVIFIILFVFAITGFTQNKVEEQKTQYEFSERLVKELEKHNIQADVDKFSGRIKISDLELFELNSYELSDRGKQYLAKFVPIYFNTIMKDPEIRKNISQIIIEGHTDSQAFADARTPEMKYYKNMDLSLKRASSVARYIIFSDYEGKAQHQQAMFKLLSVQGKGQSEPVIVNGHEDFAKSRRVELKIMFKDDSILDTIKNNQNSKAEQKKQMHY